LEFLCEFVADFALGVLRFLVETGAEGLIDLVVDAFRSGRRNDR